MNNKGTKLLALSWRERWLLVQAAALLGGAWLALGLQPPRGVHQALPSAANHEQMADRTRPSIDDIAAAMRHARHLLPQATCLPQAVAGQRLLARYGYPAEVRLGASRGKNGTLEAHAWVVCDQRVVVGAVPDLARYAPLAVGKAG